VDYLRTGNNCTFSLVELFLHLDGHFSPLIARLFRSRCYIDHLVLDVGPLVLTLGLSETWVGFLLHPRRYHNLPDKHNPTRLIQCDLTSPQRMHGPDPRRRRFTAAGLTSTTTPTRKITHKPLHKTTRIRVIPTFFRTL